MSNTTDKDPKAEYQFSGQLLSELEKLANIGVGGNASNDEVQNEFIALQAKLDKEFTKAKAKTGMVMQADACVVVALLHSQRLGLTSANNGDKVDKLKGMAANLFPRLTTLNIAKVPFDSGPLHEHPVTSINKYLRPKVLDGEDLEDPDKEQRKDQDKMQFINEVDRMRRNLRPTIDLGLLLYSLNYKPSDFIPNAGWKINRRHLIPIEKNKKGQVINYLFPSFTDQHGQKHDTAEEPIILHSRDDGYRYVNVQAGEGGASKLFPANVRQLMTAWRTTGNENARETLNWAKARDWVRGALKKPLNKDEHPAIIEMTAMLIFLRDAHPDLQAAIETKVKSLQTAAADAEKKERIEEERKNGQAATPEDVARRLAEESNRKAAERQRLLRKKPRLRLRQQKPRMIGSNASLTPRKSTQ